VLNGSFFFKGFVVQSFDLKLETRRLSVLSEASKQTLKSIYGPLAIRTESGPLTFSGTFDRPMLAGDISIVQGFLTLPQTDVSSAELNDGITYRIKNEEPLLDTTRRNSLPDSLKHIISTIADTENVHEYNDTAFEKAAMNATASPAAPEPQLTSEQLSFQDKMLYDLRISVPGNLWFTINLNNLSGGIPQQLVAEIKTDGQLTFRREEAGAKYKVDGIINITDKSSYKLIKEFSPVSGTISFVEELDNPGLDITAEYTGQHKNASTNTDETIKIKLIIQGTRNDLRFTMELYRKTAQGDFVRDSRQQDQVQTDVLTYLATGNFASDTPGQNNSNGVTNATYSVGSGILSSAIANYLNSKSGDLRIRGLGYEYGGSLESKLKLSAGYKDVVLNIGGTVNNATRSFTSADFSAEIPFSTFMHFPLAKKILFMPESHLGTDPLSGFTQQPIFLLKIVLRLP
jgi:hypothetical protein